MENSRFKFRFWNTLRKKYEDTYCVGSNGITLDYVIPEQCTGLKDKNGKLIYEGDIIEETFLGIHRRVVRWLDTKCGFNISQVGTYDDGKVRFTRENEYVIIGNIHENKELC